MRYLHLIIFIVLIGSSLEAQRNRLVGVSQDKLYLINPETAETEEVAEIQGVGDKRIRDLVYVRKDSLFYGVVDTRDDPSLVRIDWEGNFTILGKLRLPERSIYTCEGLTYHAGTETLWASVSLDGNDFYSESIVTVSLDDGFCEYIGQLRMPGRQADADNLEFLGDRLYIDDGLPTPSNRTAFYTLELSALTNNNGAILEPILDSEFGYQSTQDLAAFSVDKMYYTTANAELGEWQLPSGDTRNQPFSSLVSSDVMTGLAVVPGEKGTTSVSVLPNVEVVLFPNPVVNYLHIRPERNYKYRLYSLAGQQLMSGEGHKIDVANLDSGVYFIRLGEGALRKVIISHKQIYP